MNINQPRLKWLLLALFALALGVIVWGVTRLVLNKETMPQNQNIAQQGANDKSAIVAEPTEEEITAQLEKLQPTEPITEPTEEEITAQLEKLKQ